MLDQLGHLQKSRSELSCLDEQRMREIVREEIEAAGLKRPDFNRETVAKLIDEINEAGKDGKHVIVRP